MVRKVIREQENYPLEQFPVELLTHAATSKRLSRREFAELAKNRNGVPLDDPTPTGQFLFAYDVARTLVNKVLKDNAPQVVNYDYLSGWNNHSVTVGAKPKGIFAITAYNQDAAWKRTVYTNAQICRALLDTLDPKANKKKADREGRFQAKFDSMRNTAFAVSIAERKVLVRKMLSTSGEHALLHEVFVVSPQMNGFLLASKAYRASVSHDGPEIARKVTLSVAFREHANFKSDDLNYLTDVEQEFFTYFQSKQFKILKNRSTVVKVENREIPMGGEVRLPNHEKGNFYSEIQ